MKIKRHKKLDRIDFASACAVGIPGHNCDMRQKAWMFARDPNKPRKGFAHYVEVFANDHRPPEPVFTLDEVLTGLRLNSLSQPATPPDSESDPESTPPQSSMLKGVSRASI